MVNKVSNLDS